MPHKILIADDQPHMRMLIEFGLSKGGFHFIFAHDGTQAVALATEEKPDLIVMDVYMPGLDGLGAVRQLQANPDTARIPVILMSGREQAMLAEDGKIPGISAYFTKPFSPSQLLDETQRLLAV